LLAAGLLYARLVIIAFDDPHRARRMLKIIRFHNPSVPTLVRTRDDSYLASLQQCGATEIIPETLELSLMMASHMLLFLGFSTKMVRQKISDIKSYRYQMMRSYYTTKADTLDHEEQIFAHAVVITDASFSLGKTIDFIKSESFPAKIRSFTRRGIRSFQEPCADAVLEEGDIVIIEGTKQAIYISEERFLNGGIS